MMKKFFGLVIIFLIVIVSGCTQETAPPPEVKTKPAPPVSGVVIDSFAITSGSSSINSGDEVELNAAIRNTGNSEAKNIKIELLGLTPEWVITPSALQQVNLLPPKSLGGNEWTAQWLLKSPAGKRNDLTYDIELRVYYSYETHSDNLWRIANQKYIEDFPKSQQEAEKQKLGAAQTNPGDDPVRVYVKSEAKVVTSPSMPILISFDVKNEGGGHVTGNEVFVQVSNNLDCGSSIINGRIKFAQDSTVKKVTCKLIDFGGLSFDKSDVKVLPIKITLMYEYWVKNNMQIKVLKVVPAG